MLRIHSQGIAPDGKPFRCFDITNNRGMTISIMDWGATWVSCRVPVEQQLREVLLGCRIEDYPKQTVYLGATIGRYANRIANARFRLQGKTVCLVANQGKHQLHGGKGFDKRRWNVEKCGDNFVTFSLFSADGDQGFIGNLQVQATYQLTEDNAVLIRFNGITDQNGPLNLTNHAYFNLDNAEIGTDVRQHYLQIKADYFLPVDQHGIPNNILSSVKNTSFDFESTKQIARDFMQGEQCSTKGYDHAFLLHKNSSNQPCATLYSADKKLTMKVSTSQPALQVYTGNYLAGTPNRWGSTYNNYAGIALETESLPDTPNHLEWHKFGGMAKADSVYSQWTEYRFE